MVELPKVVANPSKLLTGLDRFMWRTPLQLRQTDKSYRVRISRKKTMSFHTSQENKRNIPHSNTITRCTDSYETSPQIILHLNIHNILWTMAKRSSRVIVNRRHIFANIYVNKKTKKTHQFRLIVDVAFSFCFWRRLQSQHRHLQHILFRHIITLIII